MDGAKKEYYEIFARVTLEHGAKFEEIQKALGNQFASPSKVAVVQALIELGYKEWVSNDK